MQVANKRLYKCSLEYVTLVAALLALLNHSGPLFCSPHCKLTPLPRLKYALPSLHHTQAFPLPVLPSLPFLRIAGDDNYIYPFVQDPNLGVLLDSSLSILPQG